MEGTKTKPIFVNLPEHKHRRLKTLAARQGTTMTVLITGAVDRLLQSGRSASVHATEGEQARAS